MMQNEKKQQNIEEQMDLLRRPLPLPADEYFDPPSPSSLCTFIYAGPYF
jgi:hypothetical protein